jgi:hypothetical protein
MQVMAIHLHMMVWLDWPAQINYYNIWDVAKGGGHNKTRPEGSTTQRPWTLALRVREDVIHSVACHCSGRTRYVWKIYYYF